MAAVLEVTWELRGRESSEGRRHATERLRDRTSRLANRFGLTPAHWREITRGNWPETAGRWEEPRGTQSSQDG